MATLSISEQQSRDDSFAVLDTGSTDVLDLLSDTILDDLTEAIDAFEPLTPLELVLGDWETTQTEPEKPIVAPSSPADVQNVPGSAEAASEQHRAPMKNPSRERLRAELRFLRQRVVEMERELEAARQQQLTLQTRKRAAVPWDQVARNELTKRQRAEDENRQLCSALAKQTTVAKSLERVLRDHLGAEAFAGFCDIHKRTVSTTTATSVTDNDALFTRLEQEVIHAYSTVDRVLGECEMNDAEVRHACSQTDVKTLAATDSSGLPQILLELVDSKLVPFDFARTCDAFWRALSTANVYQHHDVDLLSATPTSIRFASHLPWNHNGEQRRLRCVVVMKQFVTANRMVVVWRGLMASTEDGSGVHSVAAGWEETGWIVVREMETRPDEGVIQEEKPCVLQTITRHVPHWRASGLSSSKAAAARERELGAFTSMVLSATEDDMAHITGAMQSLLLAEVLDGVSAAAAIEP